jgi:hypothetical protein
MTLARHGQPDFQPVNVKYKLLSACRRKLSRLYRRCISSLYAFGPTSSATVVLGNEWQTTGGNLGKEQGRQTPCFRNMTRSLKNPALCGLQREEGIYLSNSVPQHLLATGEAGRTWIYYTARFTRGDAKPAGGISAHLAQNSNHQDQHWP